MYSATTVQNGSGEIITAEFHESGIVLRSSLPSRENLKINFIDLYDLIETKEEIESIKLLNNI